MRKVALEETLFDECQRSTGVEGLLPMPHLFTFCPPGPDDLLKLTSQTALLRIVSASSLASHFLAASISASSSLLLPPPRLDASHLVADVRGKYCDWKLIGLIVCRRITWRSITSDVA